MLASPREHRPAGLAAVALVLLVGCDSGPGQPTRVAPTVRLVDLLAVAAGRIDGDAAMVGDETRYVLAGVPTVSLFGGADAPRGLAVPATGTLELSLSCPPEIAGRPLALDALVMARRVPVPPAWTCRTRESATLELPGLNPGAPVAVEVVARMAPATRVETPPLELAPGAELRLALGLADPGPVAQVVPARFRIVARGANGAERTLLDRTLDPARRRADGKWVERRRRLDGVAAALGTRVAFVFETIAGPGPRPAFPVWGDPTLFAPTAAPAAPSLLLVSLDALRADRLGAYGAARPTSPRIDALAAAGTLFSTAVAQATWTLPSHATMLTGTYPCVHSLGVADARRLPVGIVPLASTVRAHGYETAAFTEDAYMDPTAFQRGFGRFAADASVDFHRPEGRAARTVARARRWLRRDAVEPFLLFVHTYQVHAPYEPPPGWRARLDAAGAPPADPDLADYEGEVRYTDAMLGRLLDTLARQGRLARTIVVVTSDHGEAFGEHGQRTHGPHLYEENVRIPLVFHGPGIVAGRRVEFPAGLVDLVPTVLDLLGLPIPAGVQGMSLAATVRSDGTPPAVDRLLFTEAPIGLGPAYAIAVRGAGWKGIVGANGGVQAFALTTDPAERRPVLDPALAARIRDAHARFVDECARVRALVAGTAPPAPVPPDPLREQKLRALGYAG